MSETSRYLSSELWAKIQLHGFLRFPFGTLFVNVLGSFLIGIFFNAFEHNVIPKEFRVLIITGFLGGFTTFSTYSLESAQALLHGNVTVGIANIIANNVLSILGVILGLML